MDVFYIKDIIIEIFKYLDIKTVIRARGISHSIRAAIKSKEFLQIYQKFINYPINHLTLLLEFAPDHSLGSSASRENSASRWKWDCVSGSPNINWNVVTKYSDKPWCWIALSDNPNITLDIIKQNPDEVLKQKFRTLSQFRNGRYILTTPQWHWYNISRSIKITKEELVQNSDLPWDKIGLSINRHLNESPPFGMYIISPFTYDKIDYHIMTEINWMKLSSSPHITWDFVVQYKDKPWNSHYLSRNPIITWDIVMQNPDFTIDHGTPLWDWNALSQNIGITWENVLEHLCNMKNSKSGKGSLRDKESPRDSPSLRDKESLRDWNWVALAYNKFRILENL
jgi:hypothetical protein